MASVVVHVRVLAQEMARHFHVVCAVRLNPMLVRRQMVFVKSRWSLIRMPSNMRNSSFFSNNHSSSWRGVVPDLARIGYARLKRSGSRHWGGDHHDLIGDCVPWLFHR